MTFFTGIFEELFENMYFAEYLLVEASETNKQTCASDKSKRPSFFSFEGTI